MGDDDVFMDHDDEFEFFKLLDTAAHKMGTGVTIVTDAAYGEAVNP